MSKTQTKEKYLGSFHNFKEQLNGGSELAIHKIREQAIESFSQLNFPTLRSEEWKYTNISPILNQDFVLAKATETSYDLTDYLIKDLDADLVVFVNGFWREDLSSLQDSQAVVTDLAKAMQQKNSSIDNHLTRYAGFQDEVFTALNTAFMNQGCLIYVPANVVVERPIHILHLSDSRQQSFFTNPRNLFVADKNSQVTIIETFRSIQGEKCFNNCVAEIVLHENARVDHTKIQEENENVYRISTQQIYQKRDSVYTSVAIDLGGSIVRNNINVHLDDENCQANLYGFYMGNNNQLIDNHTFIDHAKPHCNSNELYKGILDNKAKGVFNGKVLVRQDAQKTNAFQSNQSILLTDEASVDTKPQLEIFADDVKCSHGATVGELDDSALFYLRARGISEQDAHMLLRQAFANDVLDKISLESVKNKANDAVVAKFHSKAS